jgi:hypothetical protein
MQSKWIEATSPSSKRALTKCVANLSAAHANLETEMTRFKLLLYEYFETTEPGLHAEIARLREEIRYLREENFRLRQDTLPYNLDNDSVWGSPSNN